MYVFERFLRNTFSTDISRRGGSALYRDSKEQYNADCLAMMVGTVTVQG